MSSRALHPSESALISAAEALPASAAAARQETDLWWGSYAGRDMAPGFLLCALLTVAIGLAAWIVWEFEHVNVQLVWHATMGLVLLVWVPRMIHCTHRMLTCNYRLTTLRLCRDRGFRRPADGEVDLASVRDVRVEYHGGARFLDVGRIRVVAAQGPPLVLEGVRFPEDVAAMIRAAAQHARALARPAPETCSPEGPPALGPRDEMKKE